VSRHIIVDLHDGLRIPLLLTLSDDRVLQDLVYHCSRAPGDNQMILMEVDIKRILHDVWDVDGSSSGCPIVRSLNLDPEND
jgi:hypothetical protein